MNVLSEFTTQWEGVRRSFHSNRLAHAYCIVGSPRGNAAAFAEAMLKLVFCSAPMDERPCGVCTACSRVEKRIHPDLIWIEPQSKSRVIRVDEMRLLNNRLQQTSYEGGWKGCVIAYADRLNDQSANAFLKTLEEPSGHTLLLLLTDSPHQMLPTILSRCQTIMLSTAKDALEVEWSEAMLDLLREESPSNVLGINLLSERLCALLDQIKTRIEDEDPGEVYSNPEETKKNKDVEDRIAARIQSRLLEVRARMLTMLMQWQRDLLLCTLDSAADTLAFPEQETVLREQAQTLTVPLALERVKAVEQMVRRLDRNMPPAFIFESGFGDLLLKR